MGTNVGMLCRTHRVRYCCTQPGLRALLLASQTGTHGVWNPGRWGEKLQQRRNNIHKNFYSFTKGIT